jgi:hypothetical protein
MNEKEIGEEGEWENGGMVVMGVMGLGIMYGGYGVAIMGGDYGVGDYGDYGYGGYGVAIMGWRLWGGDYGGYGVAIMGWRLWWLWGDGIGDYSGDEGYGDL